MLLHKATQGASLLFRSSSQQLLMVAAGQDVSSALQCCAVSQLLSAVLGAQQLFTAGNQLMPARAASSGSKGRGRKKPSNAKGYDRLLSQWAHMTAKPGSNSSSKGKGQRPHGECCCVLCYHCNGSADTPSSRLHAVVACLRYHLPSLYKSCVVLRSEVALLLTSLKHVHAVCRMCCRYAAFSGNATPHHSASKPKKRKTTSASSSWYWDADMAQAAAAAQLHPDELHNLVFGGSDSSSKGSSRRQQRKATRKRAKTLRKQAAGMGAAYDGFGFAWAEGSEDARTYGAYASDDTDSDSYSDSDDDEYLAGAYSYFSPGRRASSRQQRQWDWRQAQPDWQWWTEEQERCAINKTAATGSMIERLSAAERSCLAQFMSLP